MTKPQAALGAILALLLGVGLRTSPTPGPGPGPTPASDLARNIQAAYAADKPTDPAAKAKARNILSSLYQIVAVKVLAQPAGTTVAGFLDLKNRAMENALGKDDLSGVRAVTAKELLAIAGNDATALIDANKIKIAQLYQQASDILDNCK